MRALSQQVAAALTPAERAWSPGPARSLSNLGQRLRDLWRWEEGLRVEEEAMEVLEQFAKANPAAYESALARSLANLSTRLGHCGRPQESLTRAEQALAIRRRLAGAAPDVHGLGLAEFLAALGSALAAAGRHEEAPAAVTEAVRRLGELSEAEPDAHRERPARALVAFAKVSLDGGHDLAPAFAASNELRGRDARAHEPPIAALLAVRAGLLPTEAKALHRFPRTGDPAGTTGMTFPLRPPRRHRGQWAVTRAGAGAGWW
ncbi:tetratricopeptide repeat protein [Streptomyces sp. 7R007]